MTTIGYATLQIIPSLKGVSSAIDKELKGQTASVNVSADQGSARASGEQAGRAIGAGAEKGVTGSSGKLGGLLVKGLKGAALVGGAGVATAFGAAFTKGFNRLADIDAAEAKLRGLGKSSEEVGGIIDAVKRTVEGTSFSTSQFADAAALFSGMELEGNKLERTLKTLANTAASATNSSVGELQGIMQKVIANNGMTLETFDQLNERVAGFGPKMADAVGIPFDQLRDKITELKPSTETALSALDAATGDTAQEMGKTFKGSFDNMLNSLGILGAALLGPVFQAAPPVLQAMTDGVKGLASLVQPAIEGVKSAISGVVDAFKGVVDFVSRNSAVFGTLGAAIGGVAAVIGAALLPAFVSWLALMVKMNVQIAAFLVKQALFSGAAKVAAAAQWLWNAALTANPIGIVVAAIAGLVAGLVYFFTQTETGRKIWTAAWGAIKAAVSAVVDWFVNTAWPFMQEVWEAIGAGWDWLVTKAQEVWDGIKAKFTTMVDWFKGLPSAIADATKGMWDGLKNGLVSVLRWIADKWNRLAESLSFTIPDWVPVVGGNKWQLPLIPAFARGGHTGNLAADQIAGVVHGGEYVINKKSTDRLESAYPGLLGTLNGYAAGGLVAGTAELRKIIGERFGITNIGGYRGADGYNEHSTGRALDVMTGKDMATGDAVKDFAIANAKAIDLKWAIWRQRTWYPDGSSKKMEDRGSPTQNHMDHVHIFSGPGIKDGLLGSLKSKEPEVAAQPDTAVPGGAPASAVAAPSAASSSGSGGSASVPSSLSEMASFGLNGLGEGVGKTSSGKDLSVFAGAAGAAVSGQVSSALGVLGAGDTPGWLKGASEFIGGISVSDANGKSIFGGGSSSPLIDSGEGVTPLSAQPIVHGGTAASAPGPEGGPAQQQQPGVVYNIQSRDTEDAFIRAQRQERERAAAKLSRF